MFAELIEWDWSNFEPAYQELTACALAVSNVEEWLREWTRVIELGDELSSRLFTATTVNTADQAAESRFQHFMEKTYPGFDHGGPKIERKIAGQRSGTGWL